MNYNTPTMLTVKQLIGKDTYIIPMYQRNFAWNVNHLKQLVQDIWDSVDSDRQYYIGTLVVHLRPDGKYEIVDGQQRTTTLNIFLCALKNNEILKDEDAEWFKGINLTYEFRENSTKTLNALYLYENRYLLTDENIISVYDSVLPVINSVIPVNELERFVKYMLEKVIITRVTLPDGTDLNHYFEIMNSRGEQLEKHEILKARILGEFQNDQQKCALIGMIWDACSNMDSYIQMNIKSTEIRDAIFGQNWDECNWTGLDDLINRTKDIFENLPEKERDINVGFSLNNYSIEDILYAKRDNITNNISIDNERFAGIINFPNFLLQVLRVITKEDIPLDDKRLLSVFNENIKGAKSADLFVSEMLRLRFLLDKFVIKRDYNEDKENGKFSIRYLKHDKKGEYNYNITGDSDSNRNVVMLQSMFHVSLPSQNYKHWLSATLNYLHQEGNQQDTCNGLVGYLEELSRSYMLGRFLAEKSNSDRFYYNLIFENEGKFNGDIPQFINLPEYTDHIDLFIFNYIDYCLWKKDPKVNFDFTSRSSIEHFYPQNPMENHPRLEDEYLHNIGNLCLISSNKNSKLTNHQPRAKCDYYVKMKIDSLKQQRMMNIVADNRMKDNPWWKEEIYNHRQEIIKLLEEALLQKE